MDKKELVEMLLHVKNRREDQESNRVVWKNKISEAEKSQSTLEEKANLLGLKSELEAIELDIKLRGQEYQEYATEALELLKEDGHKPYQSMKFNVEDTDNSYIEILFDENDQVFANGPISRL